MAPNQRTASSEVEQRDEGLPDLLQQQGADVAEDVAIGDVHDAVDQDRADVLALCSRSCGTSLYRGQRGS